MLTTEQQSKVSGVFEKYGIPRSVWLPIMYQESGGNVNSHATVGEDSRGLFQINIKANPQYANVDLYDPVKNAEIAAKDFILPSYKKALIGGLNDPGEVSEYVWKNGIRPNWDLVVRNKKDLQLKQQAIDISMYDQKVTNVSFKDDIKKWLDKFGYAPDSIINKDKDGNITKDGNPYTPTQKEKDSMEGKSNNPYGLPDTDTIVWIVIGIIFLALGLFIAFNPLAGIASVVKGAIK